MVVVEDLISTGGSSLLAVEALRNEGANIKGMAAIFTYGFPIAQKSMKEARVELTTLCDYDAILDEALRTDYIDQAELKILQDWRKEPEKWGNDKKSK